jgi:hypothetical protein
VDGECMDRNWSALSQSLREAFWTTRRCARERSISEFGEFQFNATTGAESRGNLAARNKAMPRSCLAPCP